jgi:ABC-type transporter Mla subunit MlaD
MDPTRQSRLNEHQQRRLIATCPYVDRLVADVERSFNEAQSNSPFGHDANDLAPAEQRLVRDYVARLRPGDVLCRGPSTLGAR